MNPIKSRITAAVAGSAVLASAGFVIGSQADDGSAQAASKRNGVRSAASGMHPPGLSSLADRLGVEASALRQALAELRPDRAAFEDRFAEDLATELGVTADKVSSALKTVRAKAEKRDEQREAQFVTSLAEKLDIPEAKVRAVLGDGPFGGAGHHGGSDDGPGGSDDRPGYDFGPPPGLGRP